VKNIAANVAANQYRFSSLVPEMVKSLPFQRRRGEAMKLQRERLDSKSCAA
jgi:hypothetical protein